MTKLHGRDKAETADQTANVAEHQAPVVRDSFSDAVLKLYDSQPIRVNGFPYPQLKRGATVSHRGMLFSVGDIPGVGRVVFFAPEKRQGLNGFLIQHSGYMQLPTSMLTEKVLEPLLPIMEARGLVGVAYAHGGRGSSNLMVNQGRWGIKTLQNHVAQQINLLLKVLQNEYVVANGDTSSAVPIGLIGHSQGAQTIAHELSNPARYGFQEGQIRGATLINSVALPHSQAMLRTSEFVTNIARRVLLDVGRSLLSGDGLLLRGEDAHRAFIGEGNPHSNAAQRITMNTYPAETAWFVQTLTNGTSPKLDPAKVRGMPISLLTSEDDQLVGESAQKMTHRHVVGSTADVLWKVVPGRHFSPIFTPGDEPVDRMLDIVRRNALAFDHAFQNM